MLIIALVLAIGIGVYFFLGQKPPTPGGDTKGVEGAIDSVFAKQGISRQSFFGALPVRLEESGVDSKIKPSSLTGLSKDLNALSSQAKTGQEKSLVAIYAQAAALSEKKYDLLAKLQQLSSEIQGKDRQAACAYKERLDALNLAYTDFFVALTNLSLQEIEYAEKYGEKKPLGISIDEERGTMDSLSFLSELYSSCAQETGAA